MNDFPEVKSSFKDYSWLIFGNASLLVLSVAYMSMLTRILGPDGYGILSLFLLVVQGIFTFFINWTSAAVIRYGREEFITTGKISQVFWGRSFILSICLLAAMSFIFLLRQRLAAYIGIPLNGVWWLIASVLVLTILSFIQYIFQAVRMIKHYTLSQVLEKLIQVAVLGLVLAGLWSKNIVFIIALLAATSALTVFWCLWNLKRKLFLPVTLEPQALRKIFIYSYPVIFGAFSAYLVSWIDIIVIKKYMTISDVGVYSVAYRGMSLIQQMGMLTNVVLGPLLISFVVTKRHDLVERYVKRLIPQAMIIWTGLLLLSLLAGQIMVPLFFGNRFITSLPPFNILIFGLFFNGIVAVYSPIFGAYEWIKQSMAINVTMALVNLVADFMLVPVLGLNGAALATMLAMGISAVLFFVMIGKYLKIRPVLPLLMIMPLFLAVGWLLIKPSIGHGLLACLLGIGLLYLLARKMSLFAPADLSIIEKIDMPLWFKDFLVKHIYLN